MASSEDDNKEILVYHHRYDDFVQANGIPLEDLDAHGIGIITYGKLKRWMNEKDHRDFQYIIKKVKSRHETIWRGDLLKGGQVDEVVAHGGNLEQNLTAVDLPNGTKAGVELYIISRASFKNQLTTAAT